MLKLRCNFSLSSILYLAYFYLLSQYIAYFVCFTFVIYSLQRPAVTLDRQSLTFVLASISFFSALCQQGSYLFSPQIYSSANIFHTLMDFVEIMVYF